MFDGSLPEIGELPALSDAAVVDAAGGWARVEAAACARKQAALAEQFARRTGLDADERELWWIDPEAAVTAELAAALHVSQGIALSQTHRGVALRDRLPKVAALFEAGLIDDLLVRTIVWRTYLIEDPETMAEVDAALAERVRAWGPLSAKKTEQAIDALIEQFDPGALRRPRACPRRRDVVFGSLTDEAGFTSLWALLHAGDAAVLQHRIDELVRSVCEADPRTMSERRADALTALGARQTALACECGGDRCDATGRNAAPPISTVVHVVADSQSVAAAASHPDREAQGAVPAEPRNTARTEPETPAGPIHTEPEAPAPAPHCATPPAFVIGGGVLPTALLAEVLKRAKVARVRHPGTSSPEPRYRPSRELDTFVRCRDLTCRWPNCDKPADICDVDHTVPYPHGPTHASNLKCLCRFHHLLKTFYCGPGGWSDRQLPDGTVVWTAPGGHTYTTHPGSKYLFPALCVPTGAVDLPEWTPDAAGDRGAMMPNRRHTRAHNRARAKAAERRLNDDLVAERSRPPPF